MTDYEDKLAQEAELWGKDAERSAQSVPPDWKYHRSLRHNAIYHTADIDAFLQHVQPGMTTLELGCGSGWLTLAMAQRGAHAKGIDISDKALNVARRYYESMRETIAGSPHYEAADLNTIQLPAAAYDVIAVKGTLHHLTHMDAVIAQMESGVIWGLSSAMYEEITIKDGRVEQSNFHDYQALRINEIPVIEVHIVKSNEAPGGMGEPGTSALPPAVTNAIFAATGIRLRKLPIDASKLKT